MADPSEAFAGLAAGPGEPPLDRACLLIAAHARPDLDIEAEVGELDALAAGCPDATFDGWRHYLFTELGFTGNVANYHDPDNSFLDQVVRRRVGLPITLAVLGLEVGRRLGIPFAGVGMPGHFLLRHEGDPAVYVDGFAGGRILDEAGCAARFREIFGRDAAFDPALLNAVGARAILGRMLANLRTEYARRADLESLTWVLRLRMALPETAPDERRQLAAVLARQGAFVAAAEELEALAGADPGHEDELRAEAGMLRARLN